jgi:hypothetical protein
VIYEIESQWPAGGHQAFQGDLQVVNLTPKVLTTWTLGWSFPNDQTIFQSWGAEFHQAGRTVTAKSEPNEGWINANGGRFHLGFLGNLTSTNAVPATFTFNGQSCPVVNDKLQVITPAGNGAGHGTVGPPVVTTPPAGTRPPVATTPPASTGVTCKAVYEVESTWPAGAGKAFQGDIQIINTSPRTLTTWSFTWSFANDQKIYQSWGADLTQKGGAITANSEPNEGFLAGNGGRFHLGFLANFSTTNTGPVNFAHNGVPCPLVAG